MLPGEGIVYAVSRHFHIEFGKVKTANDVSLVSLAAVISLVYLGVIEAKPFTAYGRAWLPWCILWPG